MSGQEKETRPLAELPVQLKRKADQFLDDEAQQQSFADLGQKFYRAFHPKSHEEGKSGKKKSPPVSSQLRNLQQIAVSAARFSEIEDFVKHQMGRSTKSAEPWRQVGEKILEQLQALRKKAREFADSNKEQEFLLRQYLARGWI
ncbi:MAG: hypothetical protein NZ899_13710, partial [Thermoguttaceae bacterium]|nr:hypothetical protein [Thermoguttaceae bacterium]